MYVEVKVQLLSRLTVPVEAVEFFAEAHTVSNVTRQLNDGQIKTWKEEAVTYKVVSKIFRTGAAIYTVVVVARSTGPKRLNREFRVYCDVLRRLRQNVRRCLELWRESTSLLHHDNAPSHTCVLTQQLLDK
jgi:hypothetical protein